MIGTSFGAYVFIRACVFVVHYTIPLLLALCVLILSIPHKENNFTIFIQGLAIAETAFYILIYLPRAYTLQRAAVHPELLSRTERRRLFKLAHESIPDADAYLSKWFDNAPLAEIKRDNVKEFFCWAFLSKSAWGPDDEDELDEYADGMEQALGRRLKPGRGYAFPVRLTLDKIEMLHRPMMWYLVRIL